MQHLGVLHGADLVIAQRKGRQRWNHLNPLPIKAIHDRWISRYATFAVDMLASLKSDLEAAPGNPPNTARITATRFVSIAIPVTFPTTTFPLGFNKRDTNAIGVRKEVPSSLARSAIVSWSRAATIFAS